MTNIAYIKEKSRLFLQPCYNSHIDRIYSSFIKQHLDEYRQMLFLAGPRQVGKTTCAKEIANYCANFKYLNWDYSEDRRTIIRGDNALSSYLNLDQLSVENPIIVFDEIHKYKKWKQFLKGFYDYYVQKCKIIITGSAKLDIYRKGGDSLMGRYFLYRCHPLSVGELLSTKIRETEIILPTKIDQEQYDGLFIQGGFPEPFIKGNSRFTRNWQRLRQKQLLQEDIRQTSQIQEIAELEYLIEILSHEASNQLNVASIAKQMNNAESTIHRWINILNSFYYLYTIKPWFKNIRRSLRKTPKVYLWDWSLIEDQGKRFENFIASHLYKATHFWTDIGLGEYELFYLRDKEKREVDFLVTKDKKPWFLVEAKTSKNQGISKNLYYYYNQLQVQHAFQVVFDMPFIEADCFKERNPCIVPAKTFLSQLI